MPCSRQELIFMSHSEKDLILAMDETVIKSCPSYSSYPGHNAALAAYQQARLASSGKASGIKPTFERLYKIPNSVETYRTLAAAHVDAGVRPPALNVVVDRSVELAQSFRALAPDLAPTAFSGQRPG
jgi:hypothetical protein